MPLQEQANALLVAGAFDRALAAFTALEQRQPGVPFVASLRLFLARQLCDWSPQGLPLLPGEEAAATELETLRQRALRAEPALEPFTSVVMYDDPALHQAAAALWMNRWHPAVPGHPPLPRPRAAGERLRVAYVSSDFHNHATAYLLAGVLEHAGQSAGGFCAPCGGGAGELAGLPRQHGRAVLRLPVGRSCGGGRSAARRLHRGGGLYAPLLPAQ